MKAQFLPSNFHNDLQMAWMLDFGAALPASSSAQDSFISAIKSVDLTLVRHSPFFNHQELILQLKDIQTDLTDYPFNSSSDCNGASPIMLLTHKCDGSLQTTQICVNNFLCYFLLLLYHSQRLPYIHCWR